MYIKAPAGFKSAEPAGPVLFSPPNFAKKEARRMSDPQSPSTNTEVQELTGLARRFSDTARYEEAAELLLLALRLEPKNLSVKLGLAEVRKLQQQFKGTSSRSLRDVLREGFRRNAIDASH